MRVNRYFRGASFTQKQKCKTIAIGQRKKHSDCVRTWPSTRSACSCPSTTVSACLHSSYIYSCDWFAFLTCLCVCVCVCYANTVCYLNGTRDRNSVYIWHLRVNPNLRHGKVSERLFDAPTMFDNWTETESFTNVSRLNSSGHKTSARRSRRRSASSSTTGRRSATTWALAPRSNAKKGNIIKRTVFSSSFFYTQTDSDVAFSHSFALHSYTYNWVFINLWFLFLFARVACCALPN